MPTIRQKNSALTKIAVFFGNKRKILTKHEYSTAGSVPIRMNIIIRTFGTYERMINCLKEQHPYLEGMEEADKLENPQVAKKPALDTEAKKPEIKKAVAKKPEAKVTPTKEASDGKDI